MKLPRALCIVAITLLFLASPRRISSQTTGPAAREKIKSLVYDVQGVFDKEVTFLVPVQGFDTRFSDIYIRDDQKQEPRRLVEGGQDPAWSSNGQKIAFLGFRSISINLVGDEQSTPQRRDMYDPRYHQQDSGPEPIYDSHNLVAVSLANRQIEVMNADGSGRKQITNVPSGVWDFAWSPVEDKIAYCELGPDDRNAIVLINADGSGRTELTKMGEVRCAVGMPVLKHPAGDVQGVDFAKVTAGKAFIGIISGHVGAVTSSATGEMVGVPTLSWSPDGQTLAFTSVINGRAVVGIVSKNGGGPKPIVNGYAPRWSPDGKQLLFLHDSETLPVVTGICLVNADGTDPRKVLAPESAEFGLTWSPDGKSIVFASAREAKTQSEIFRVSTGGTCLQKIASSEKFSLASPVFSSDGSKLLFYSRPPWRSGLRYTDDFAIWIMDWISHQQTRLTKGSRPSAVWVK